MAETITLTTCARCVEIATRPAQKNNESLPDVAEKRHQQLVKKMPEIPIDASERQRAQDVVKFVRGFYEDMSDNGRLVLALEMLRLFDPEIKELRKRASENNEPTAHPAGRC